MFLRTFGCFCNLASRLRTHLSLNSLFILKVSLCVVPSVVPSERVSRLVVLPVYKPHAAYFSVAGLCLL